MSNVSIRATGQNCADTYETITLDEHPSLRARIVYDNDPHPPEFEGGAPVLEVEHHYRGRVVSQVYGQEVEDDMDGILQEFLNRYGWREGVEVFDRYLRIFHGGAAETMSSMSYQGGPDYVVFVTADILEDWGNVPDVLTSDWLTGQASEWQAYIDGECYGIVVEKAVTTETTTFDGDREIDFEVSQDDWIELDSLWGLYGDADGYVTEEAKRMIGDAA